MTPTVTYPPHLLSISSHVQTTPAKIALTVRSPFAHGIKRSSHTLKVCSSHLGVNSSGVFLKTRLNICCAVNMVSGQSGEPEKINLGPLINMARKIWDSSPHPVKSFPWNIVLESFIQLMLDLFVLVVKYLCVPLLAVSSLSEMSYCAHQKKLFLVPFPLLIGIVVAGALKETALELSPLLKDAEVPWHLIVTAIIFTLIKLLGPYYPYWGRIFIPHFANGVLWTTLLLAFSWYREPRKAAGSTMQENLVNGSHSET